MKRSALAIACVLATACGGGGGSKGNPATNTTFDYTQAAATTPPVGSVDTTATAVASLTAFDASPDPAGASNVVGALFDAADQVLGSTSLLGVAPASRALPLVSRVRAEAITIGGMPDSSLPAGCGVATNGVVTFDPAVCTFTDTSTPGETITVSLGGHVARLSPGAAEWSFVLTARFVMSSSSGTVTVDAGIEDSGHVSGTAATATVPGSLVAHEEAGMRVVGRASGQVLTLAMAQAADLAVSLVPATTCPTRITSGTFEAKRVWLEVPTQLRDQNPDEYRNKGVRITWTGTGASCGTATAQVVMR